MGNIDFFRLVGSVGEAAEESAEAFFKSFFGFTVTLINQTYWVYLEILKTLGSAITGNVEGTLGDTFKKFEGLGSALAMLMLTIEIFATMVGFHFDRLEDAVKVGLKYVACKVVIENSSSIVSCISSAFTLGGFDDLATESMGYFQAFNIDGSTGSMEDGLFGMNYLLTAAFNLIIWLIMGAFMVKIISHVAGICFEIVLHKAIAPIPLATLCNDAARSTGIAFIKSFAAVSMQAAVTALSFRAFKIISSPIYSAMQSELGFGSTLYRDNGLAVIVTSLAPIVSLALVCSFAQKSGDILKRMLGA